ncbi:unnamed protein product [Cylindrotheca closterium]|uniref:Uncharacterized protein n=1 Tax=Cylindrotheca closterium TaxID=2856 RepID=A0AAD2CED4_9STRA|nr:unnamed protein product [Cylindrotheca closterium]
MRGCPFINEGYDWENIAADALWRSKSLECLDCEMDFHPTPEDDWCDDELCDPSDFYKRTVFPLSMNRGYQRVSEAQSITPLSANLWSHILARAASIFYCNKRCEDDEDNDRSDFWDVPASEKSRVDVLFSLLKEQVAGQWT